jgi:hypothetical protein
MIMEHRETRTLWQQATGAAIFGPLSGHTLEMLPAQQRRWGAVRNRRGLTLAAEPESAAAAPFAAELGFRLLKSATDRITTPWRTRLSKRLPLRETVFGIRIGNASRAYPLSEISDGDGFEDEVAGVRLALNYDPATGLLTARRLDGGPDPVVERHWWLGWNEFHPQTTVYQRGFGNRG